MKSIHTQRGTAIIVALFVTALVATAAIAMIEQLRIETRQTELILNNNEANLLAEGSIAWAMDQLINDIKFKQPTKVVDKTPIVSPVNEINGATLSSVIDDAQGKLNLNNLRDAEYQSLLTQLIQLVAPNINLITAQSITKGVVDWITPGLNNTAFDQAYAKNHPAYRAPHRPMASVSELRLIKGMTPKLYAQLEPYVTALPDKTAININSAPIPVIMSFSPAIKLDMAKAFDAFRHQSPLANLNNLSNFPDIKNSPVGGNLTVVSDFFLVRTHVTIGDQHITLNTLMMRYLINSQPAVKIVWQSKGTV